MMMGHDWGFGWGGMWFGWLMMIGFTVAVIVFIVWLVKLSAPTMTPRAEERHDERQAQSALDILQTRYARGEISKEEYLDARATLGS